MYVPSSSPVSRNVAADRPAGFNRQAAMVLRPRRRLCLGHINSLDGDWTGHESTCVYVYLSLTQSASARVELAWHADMARAAIEQHSDDMERTP
jgi:hypothetical protein